MKIGELRNRIILQQCQVAQNENGFPVETWTTIATVWASKAHQSSREFFAAQKINSETTDLFIIRYRDNVAPEMRVVYNGQNYRIIGAPDPDGRRRELHLLCKELILSGG